MVARQTKLALGYVRLADLGWFILIRHRLHAHDHHAPATRTRFGRGSIALTPSQRVKDFDGFLLGQAQVRQIRNSLISRLPGARFRSWCRDACWLGLIGEQLMIVAGPRSCSAEPCSGTTAQPLKHRDPSRVPQEALPSRLLHHRLPACFPILSRARLDGFHSSPTQQSTDTTTQGHHHHSRLMAYIPSSWRRSSSSSSAEQQPQSQLHALDQTSTTGARRLDRSRISAFRRCCSSLSSSCLHRHDSKPGTAPSFRSRLHTTFHHVSHSRFTSGIVGTTIAFITIAAKFTGANASP